MRTKSGRANFQDISAVPTPTCSECGREMKPASITEWKCVKPDCPKCNQPVNTGVYPVSST